ncbi:WD40 repeat-like protein [Serendipita vermifera]|nr:WD40 repeat-like protein [Serendipita vermifera]
MSGSSASLGIPESNPDSQYRITRDNLLQATKVVKAVTEATSFLGPLKATCEMVILFLETTKAVNENTEGFKALAEMLKSHIDTLEGSWAALQEKQTEALPVGQQDFIQALTDYIKGHKGTLKKVNQVLNEREKGAKGLFKKISTSRIEPGVLATYREEIMKHSRAFNEATVVCQMNVQAEALKVARLGPEKPRPMGTQHETCLKGTREPILQEIREWRYDKEVDKRIFWLCDIGGSGKSTIAYTMSQEWDEESCILLGRFFFSKNARDTADTDTVCSILARDLASKNPELISTIADILKIDSLLTERDFAKQFSKLIVEPLRSISQDIIFVLDAVDECKLESRKRMLRVLLQEIDSLPSLKVLITSRPESDIMDLLRDKAIVRGMHFEMQGSKNQSNMADITSYVHHHLANLLSRNYREQLVTQSNGLFIWVSTARFELEMAADNPAQFESTLNTLLSRGTGGDLDTLYLGVLSRVLRGRLKDLIRRVLATLAILYEPVSITSLGRLMNANDEDIELVIKSMRSVFRVVDTIEFLHPTFREYLNGIQGKGTIPDAYISHTELALSTLATIQQDLKRDICKVDVSGLPFPDNKDIVDLNERLSSLWQQSPSLFYSSQYWALHVSQAIQNVSVIQPLGLFLETKVLNLIELLSLMDHLLRIQDVLGLQRKLELCNDVWRLVQNRQFLLQENALHVYTSSLLFLPIGARLAKIYRRPIEGDLPDILCGLDTYWPHYQTLAGHGAPVRCLSISPDGTRIASGSVDETVRIWDTMTGASIGYSLYLASTNVDKLVFSPDETRVIFYSYGWGLGSCDATTGEMISMLFQSDVSYITIFSSSSDRSRVICAHDTSLYLWDATSGERIGTASLNDHSIKCLAFSPDGSRIALGCQGGTLQLWDTGTGLCPLADWNAHDHEIICLAFSPDGTRIVSGDNNDTLRLWDTITYSSVGVVMKGHFAHILCLAFSSNGNRIVSGSWDGTLRIWDVLTGAKIREPLEGHTDAITCASFFADDTRIVSGSDDGTLRLWNVATDASVEVIQERHTQRVHVIVFSPDGNRVLSGSGDCTLRLWDAETGAAIGSAWRGQPSRIECAAFSPDGTQVVSVAILDRLRLWDVATGASIGMSTSPQYDIHRFVFSPDGTKFISCDWDHSMQLWDTACNPIGKPVKVDPSNPDHDHSITFFEDNLSFSIESGATFKISDKGIEEMGSLPPTVPQRRLTDGKIIYNNGQIIVQDVPRHTFELPTAWVVSTWAAHQAKIALGFESGRIMILDFSNMSQ